MYKSNDLKKVNSTDNLHKSSQGSKFGPGENPSSPLHKLGESAQNTTKTKIRTKESSKQDSAQI